MRKYNKMITTRFYLDTRNKREDNKYPLYVKVTNNRKAMMFNTGVKISPEHWDGGMVKNGDTNARAKNIKIRQFIDTIDRVVYELGDETNEVLKKEIERRLSGKTEYSFLEAFDEFVGTKTKQSTLRIYSTTRNKIEEYDKNATFKTMTYEWLVRYEKKMLSDGLKINFISIQMRNIRAVFNYAIDKGYTTLYPFRSYKIKREQTVKRNLSVEDVRLLMNYPCEEYQVKYRDLFMLMIYMIGINSADLFLMPPLKGKKISYIRKKTDKETATNVRRIEFTLQPEAEEIIKKYAGKKYMLDVMDTYNNHVDFLHRMNIGLQKIGKMQKVGRGGKKVIEPAFPGITSYWARHTWATLAAQLDIPKETIGAALGHAGSSVTDIYIDFDRKKIDEANRKVIDFINQKK